LISNVNQSINQSGPKTSFLAVKSVLKYDVRDALAINQVRLIVPDYQIWVAA
jgi:hypothetical protein